MGTRSGRSLIENEIDVRMLLRSMVNPPALSPKNNGVRSIAGRWWVAHTKSRFEKAFVWDLIDKGISHFLPLVSQARPAGGTKPPVLLPLFPSYVFFCGDGADRLAALNTGRLCRVIEVADQRKLVAELSDLEVALGSHAKVDRCRIPIGRWCRVIAGPMEGLKGVVINNRKGTRLVLEISILGQGVSLEVDKELLEPVEANSEEAGAIGHTMSRSASWQ